MPFPVILAWIAIAAVAGGGVAAGASGISDMQKAKDLAEAARRHHEQAVARLGRRRESTNQRAAEFGKLKVDIRRTTIRRMLDILERLEKKAAQTLREKMASFDVNLSGVMQDFKQQVFDADLVVKSLGSVATGAMAGVSAYAAVGLLGTASTGVAIGGLSGAAANSAILAWLGGGSLAAGGGGMAAGAAVLGGIVVAPALLITGFVLMAKGEKALTEARNFEAETNVQIAKVDALTDLLQKVTNRIEELHSIAVRLNERATTAIADLEQSVQENRHDRHPCRPAERQRLSARPVQARTHRRAGGKHSDEKKA